MSGRRLLRITGTLLAVLGALALALAFVTWQWGDPVTAAFTRWKQRSLTDSYRTVEQRFALPARTEAGVDSATAIRTAAARLRRNVQTGEPIGRLDVPRLDLRMVVVNGTDAASLRAGPGRDPRTFMPGEGELVYIAGHRTTFGAPFAHIDRLDRGDRIVLEMPYATVEYRVTGHAIVAADEISRLRSRGREEIALQACHPRFSAKQRYIVYGRPVRLTPAGRAATEG